MNQDIQKRTESNLPAYVAEFRAITKPTNYHDIVNCTSAKLKPFAAKYGNEALEDILMGTLAELSEGLGLPVSPTMLADASGLIIQEWPDTKLSDFLLFKSEMLMGTIGGQIKDQLWKWNTRSIIQAWREYYEVREDVFCEAREQKNNEYKADYNNGLAKAYANASPETKEMINRTADNMERLIKSKRIEAEENRPTFSQNLELHEIAENEGIKVEDLATAINKAAAVLQSESDIEAPIEIFKAKIFGYVQFEARNNPDFLNKFIHGVNK